SISDPSNRVLFSAGGASLSAVARASSPFFCSTLMRYQCSPGLAALSRSSNSASCLPGAIYRYWRTASVPLHPAGAEFIDSARLLGKQNRQKLVVLRMYWRDRGPLAENCLLLTCGSMMKAMDYPMYIGGE